MADAEQLQALAERIAVCTLCPLSETRHHAVPGEGPADAEVVFIGEGPGYHEDRLGRPFVGPAGDFLDDLLKSVQLERSAVFITNVVKCRPPQNRDPAPREIEACVPTYLDRQIEAIDPLLIVTLGRFSMAQFFRGASIMRIHGQPKRDRNRILYPMLHPAAALHRPELRELVEQDMLRIPSLLAEARTLRSSAPADEPETPDEDSPQQLTFF